MCVCMCDALAPCCLRLSPRRSLHTTLFLTHCLREEAGDAWASEVQHNEEQARTHTCTQSPSCTRVLKHLDTHAALFDCRHLSTDTAGDRRVPARTLARTHADIIMRVFPQHQTSILRSSCSQTDRTMQSHTGKACLTLNPTHLHCGAGCPC